MRSPETMTVKDYGYCKDCQMTFDLWKYSSIDDTDHPNCNWRYVTEEELKDCIEGCKEEYARCPHCSTLNIDLVLVNILAGIEMSCPDCHEIVKKEELVWVNCFTDGDYR